MKLRALPLTLKIIILVIFALPSALAQQGGQQGGGTGGTSGSGSKDPSRPSVITPPRELPKTPQRVPPLIFISGKVIQEDGTPPPFGTVIELDCRGSVTREAMVNTNGGFSFQVGDPNRLGQVLPDASERMEDSPFNDDSSIKGPFASMFPSGNQPGMYQSRIMGCELRAQMSGYRSTVVRIGAAPQQGPNDIGTILVYRTERIRGTTVSATNLLAPKAAKKSVSKAKKALQKNKLEEAGKLLKAALDAYPQYGEAWVELGVLFMQRNQYDEARIAFAKAIETDKLFVNPYIQLGWLASIEQKWQEAADYTEKSLELDPITYADMYYLNALANYNLNKLDLAEKRAKQEQRLDPQYRFPQTFLILANIRAMKNDTEGSILELRNYLKHAPNAEDAGIIRSRLQAKEKLAAVKPQ
jgi:tetratricopeptide (TPR) repeat protein